MNSSYADDWQPQSLQEAIKMIDSAPEAQDPTVFWARGEHAAKQLSDLLPDPDPDIVVDYGCGIGRALRYMRGKLRVGLDASIQMVNLATEQSPGCLYLRTDGTSLPFADNSVDFIYSLLVLQHMDPADAEAIVRETYRTLKPGGRCYHLFSAFGTPWAADLNLPSKHNVVAHTQEIVTALAQRAGFTLYEISSRPSREHPSYYALIGYR